MATDDHERESSLGRLARYPARIARGQVDEHLVPEITRVADRALAGELPEQLAGSIAEHHVIERMVEELASSGALDAMVDRAVASPRTDEIVHRVVASPAVQQAIREVVSSPEIVEALKAQTTGILDELADDVSEHGNRVDDRIEGFVRRRPVTEMTFAGLATRGAAFALDLVLLAVVYSLFTGTLALISYLVGDLARHSILGAVLGAGATLVILVYFVGFWSAAGRTPGMQVLGLRVRDPSGKPPSFRRALLRAVFIWVSIAVFFLGFVPILFDRRRRGLADYVAGTEVVYRETAPS